MSKHETWRTRQYWNQTGGLLIEEFVAVQGTKKQGLRRMDGLIVLGEERAIHFGNYYDMEGKDIIIIQTKNSRIGMSLLSQAYFSKFLIERLNPKTIRSVAICGKNDDILKGLAEEHGIEIVVFEEGEKIMINNGKQ